MHSKTRTMDIIGVGEKCSCSLLWLDTSDTTAQWRSTRFMGLLFAQNSPARPFWAGTWNTDTSNPETKTWNVSLICCVSCPEKTRWWVCKHSRIESIISASYEGYLELITGVYHLLKRGAKLRQFRGRESHRRWNLRMTETRRNFSVAKRARKKRSLVFTLSSLYKERDNILGEI